jgi:hypothetical protein
MGNFLCFGRKKKDCQDTEKVNLQNCNKEKKDVKYESDYDDNIYNDVVYYKEMSINERIVNLLKDKANS